MTKKVSEQNTNMLPYTRDKYSPKKMSANALVSGRKVIQESLFASGEDEPPAKPFLKWAGGKTHLLRGSREYLPPDGFNRYFEPCIGGDAFYFDLSPGEVVFGHSKYKPRLIYHFRE